MNKHSWQTMGLTTQDEFQAWTAQLLEGFTFPKDCIDELPALERLAVIVDSIGEIEAGFWELEAVLTCDFLPSGEVREFYAESSHQAVNNHSPNWIRSENLEPQSLMQQLPEGENIANLSQDLPVHLSQQNSGFREPSQRTTTVLENGWNALEESSSISSNKSLSNGVVHRLNAEIPRTFEHSIHSSPSLWESLPPSSVESSSTSQIPSSNPKTMLQESNLAETGKNSFKNPWIMVTPMPKTSPLKSVESTVGRPQPVVRAWMEPEVANFPIAHSINRSPLSEPPAKGLGDLANLLSLTPTQALHLARGCAAKRDEERRFFIPGQQKRGSGE